MKRLISVLLLLCLLACVPTPEQEVVVNKGDDIAGEIIRETPRTDADTQQSVVPFRAVPRALDGRNPHEGCRYAHRCRCDRCKPKQPPRLRHLTDKLL